MCYLAWRFASVMLNAYTPWSSHGSPWLIGSLLICAGLGWQAIAAWAGVTSVHPPDFHKRHMKVFLNAKRGALDYTPLTSEELLFVTETAVP
jgi:hypothetical protein